MVFIDHGADNDSGALRLGLRKRSRGERAGQHDEQGNDKVPHWQEGERAAPLHRKRTRVARMYPVGQHKTAPQGSAPTRYLSHLPKRRESDGPDLRAWCKSCRVSKSRTEDPCVVEPERQRPWLPCERDVLATFNLAFDDLANRTKEPGGVSDERTGMDPLARMERSTERFDRHDPLGPVNGSRGVILLSPHRQRSALSESDLDESSAVSVGRPPERRIRESSPPFVEGHPQPNLTHSRRRDEVPISAGGVTGRALPWADTCVRHPGRYKLRRMRPRATRENGERAYQGRDRHGLSLFSRTDAFQAWRTAEVKARLRVLMMEPWTGLAERASALARPANVVCQKVRCSAATSARCSERRW